MTNTLPRVASKIAFVCFSDSPKTVPTKSCGIFFTTSPLLSRPSAFKTLPYTSATVVLPVPGGPTKMRFSATFRRGFSASSSSALVFISEMMALMLRLTFTRPRMFCNSPNAGQEDTSMLRSPNRSSRLINIVSGLLPRSRSFRMRVDWLVCACSQMVRTARALPKPTTPRWFPSRRAAIRPCFSSCSLNLPSEPAMMPCRISNSSSSE
mmetsp:Transcript_104471/g.304964  ORF Transcript_104471/g.304964 Transcript_104471/m.304964 type:complete len:209 (-) Transcript_104471:1718-2344(-)